MSNTNVSYITEHILYNILIRSDFDTISNLAETCGYKVILSAIKPNSYWFDRFKFQFQFQNEYDHMIDWKLSYFNVVTESSNEITEKCIYNCIENNNMQFLKLLVDKSIVYTSDSLKFILFNTIIRNDINFFNDLINRLKDECLKPIYLHDSLIKLMGKKIYYDKKWNVTDFIFIYDRVNFFNRLDEIFGVDAIEKYNELNKLIEQLCFNNCFNLLHMFLKNENTCVFLIKSNIDELIKLAVLGGSTEILDILTSLTGIKIINNEIFRKCIAQGHYNCVKYIINNLNLEMEFSKDDYISIVNTKSENLYELKNILKYFNQQFDISLEWQENLYQKAIINNKIEIFEECIIYVPFDKSYNDDISERLIQYVECNPYNITQNDLNIMYRILDDRCDNNETIIKIKTICSNLLNNQNNEIVIELDYIAEIYLDHRNYNFIKYFVLLVFIFISGFLIYCFVK